MRIIKYKYYPFFFLFLINVNASLSQVYVPFPDSNAVWRQNDIWFNGFEYICRDYQLYINGDTLINGVNYHNIYWSGTWGNLSLGMGCDYAVFSTGEHKTAIREDLFKHVYLYNDWDSTEYLLYDFNLTLGDTLPPALPSSVWQGSNPIVITQIDSVQIGSSYRKRYWCSDSSWWGGPQTNYVAIIEGIGSSFGFFADLSPSWQEKDFLLLCFKLNGQDVYPVGQQCDLVPVGISEYSSISAGIIYPNPGNGIFHLLLKDIFNAKINLNIFDVLGKLILTKKINAPDGSITFDLSDKQKGVYFAKLINESKATSSIIKIIKE